MARRKKDALANQADAPASVQLAERGIHTGADFASVMSALLTDTIAGRVQPQTANAACNISDKLLKVVELQYKYGKPAEGVGHRLLALTPMGEPAKEGAEVQ